jgi:RND superfamily putative drug exporter
MNTPTLARLGQGAARRPKTVIGAWILLVVLVAAASAAFGGTLQDSMSAPGVDSQRAADLLASTQATDGGLTAQVVVTPSTEDATFVDDPAARAALARLQERAEALPHVLGTNDPTGALADGAATATRLGAVSADGRVALLRLSYPPVEQLDSADLDRLKGLADDSGDGDALQVELGGDLFFAFEQPPANLGELLGLFAAASWSGSARSHCWPTCSRCRRSRRCWAAWSGSGSASTTPCSS